MVGRIARGPQRVLSVVLNQGFYEAELAYTCDHHRAGDGGLGCVWGSLPWRCDRATKKPRTPEAGGQTTGTTNGKLVARHRLMEREKLVCWGSVGELGIQRVSS